MEVVPLSAAPVASLAWQRGGRWFSTVVAKTTFDLVPGEAALSSTQECINEVDQRWEDDPARSVHTPGDLAPLKKRADVTLVGSAYARRGAQVSSLVARLVVGAIDKAVEVFGDRVWTGSAAEEVRPFARMPRRYERASAGAENPAGVRLVRGGPMPNLAPPGRGERPPFPSIGFGPIAADWAPRRQALARAGGAPPIDASRAVPDALDDEFFSVAPRDQRLPAIDVGQRIVLENLHREHASLVTRLPGVRAYAFVERVGVAPEELPMAPDGLWIDTDRSICTLTWRALVPLTHAAEPGRVLVGIAPALERVSFADALRVAARLPDAVARSAPEVKLAFDAEDSYVETLAQRIPAEILALRAQRGSSTAPPPVPSRSEVTSAVIPAPPPSAPASAPRAIPAPPASRPTDEATHTDLFLGGDDRALFDASPAWLTPARTRTTPPPAPPAPPLAPPAPPLAADVPAPPPSAASTVDRGLLAASATSTAKPIAAPPSDRSPWATGIAAPVASEPEASSPAEARPNRPATPTEIVDLIWFDPACVARLRSRFRAIVDELDFEPLDPDHDLPVDDPAAARDRHHVFGVLTRAAAIDAQGVGRAMLEAVSAHGRFTPPLVVVAGELRFPFDDVEILKATAAAAAPLAKDDKRLTDLLAAVDQIAGTPLAQGNAGAVDALLRDLREAIQQNKRPWSLKVLDAHVERTLIGERTYQKRTVFGEPCVRALLGQGRDGGVPCYLPASMADRVPLVAQMKVKLLVEAHASQDQLESHPHALRVVALGRALSLEGLRVR